MVKTLTRKLKDIEIEITFAEPREYDTASRPGTFKKKLNTKKRGGRSKTKK